MKEKEILLLRLVELMFEKEQTFLLIDELYEDEIVGTFIRNIQIDSPYQQLMFEGILSQFSIEGELIVNITVENYFHHLLAMVLQKDQCFVTPESLIQLAQSNNLKGIEVGVSNLLSFDIELGDFNRITHLIDLSHEDEAILGICVIPLVNSLMIHGVEKTVEVILENPTDNDWKIIKKIIYFLQDLQSIKLLIELINLILFKYNYRFEKKSRIELEFIKFSYSDQYVTENELNEQINAVDSDVWKEIYNDTNFIFLIAEVYYKFNYYYPSWFYFDKAFNIELKRNGFYSLEIIKSLVGMGVSEFGMNQLQRAIGFLENSIELSLKLNNSLYVGTAYEYLGRINKVFEEYDIALDFFKKHYDFNVKEKGYYHFDTSNSFFLLGTIYDWRSGLNEIIYLEKCLDIRTRILNINNIQIAQINKTIGLEYYGQAIINLTCNLDPILAKYKIQNAFLRTFEAFKSYFDNNINNTEVLTQLCEMKYDFNSDYQLFVSSNSTPENTRYIEYINDFSKNYKPDLSEFYGSKDDDGYNEQKSETTDFEENNYNNLDSNLDANLPF